MGKLLESSVYTSLVTDWALHVLLTPNSITSTTSDKILSQKDAQVCFL